MTNQILVLGQAFKGTHTAASVTGAVTEGARAAGVRAVPITGSDGGDGLIEALHAVLDPVEDVVVSDPLGRPVVARIGWLADHTAVVESRMACGLSLLRVGERDPLRTSTEGVGQLVREAELRGATRVFIGLGGSATMDGGLGMARVWGWSPRDEHGRSVALGGGALTTVAAVRRGPPRAARIVGLYDVDNPLLGSDGAVVYAAQKGASPEDGRQLERGLERLVSVLGAESIASTPGAGAAGGLGFGVVAFGGGTLTPGARWVLEQLEFDTALERCDGLVVCEGAFDATSLHGKLTGEAIMRAQRQGKPVVLLAPQAANVPNGVLTETNGGTWSLGDLRVRAERGVRALLRLLGADRERD